MTQPDRIHPERGTPAPTFRRNDDFDITRVDWPAQDKWDRLYRNIVLVLIAVGIAVGLYFKL
jgi:hypothetical protein